MPNYHMGELLGQPELPAGSPRPPETPPGGIIVVDRDPDGYTRRYLYRASMGGEQSEVLISETPTDAYEAPKQPARIPARTPAKQVRHPVQRPEGTPVPAQRPIEMLGASQAPKLGVTPIPGEAKTVTLPVKAASGPRMGEAMAVPSRQEQLPIISKQLPVLVDDSAVRDRSPIHTQKASAGGPTSFLENSVKVVGLGSPALGNVNSNSGLPMPASQVVPQIVSERKLSLGQAQPTAQPSAPPPAEEPYVPVTCPGAVEMPDGRIIDPDDDIKLRDLCELMPFLLESYGKMLSEKGKSGQVSPGQNVPVVGQQRSAGGAVPSAASQFGPASGPGGGGGFIASGGGGPGPAGPKGNVGAQGAVGPAGFGGLVDSVTKTDGDFSAGPGAFISVPGTSIMFTQGQAGPATFLLSASLGTVSGAPSTSQSGQIGLRIDGTDYPVASRLLHTFAVGVAEYIVGQAFPFVIPSLAAGPHTVEVILRGLAPAEFGGAAIGSPLSVAADPIQPLQLSVIHN